MEKLQRQSGLLFRLSIYLLFYYFFLHAFLEEFETELSLSMVLITALIFIGYTALSAFHIKFLVRRLFDRKKFLLYSIVSISALFLSAYFAHVVAVFLMTNTLPNSDNSMLLHRTGYFVFVGLIMMGLGLYFHFTDRWQAMSDKITAFEKAKREAELAALKAQVHPHFLFNVLNSIYGLSLEKSDKTSASILKLSNLMSYVLYDSTKEKVKLRNELDFLESYVELEKLRFEDKIDVKLDLEVDFPEKEIAPLIFIPFVENAFKHFGSDNEEVPHVHFSLQMKSEQYIVFKSSNSVSVNGSQKRNPYQGIGINNITKQIDYLYPERHVLDIRSGENHYTVYLKINLT